MNKWAVISMMGVYTFIIVYGIHHYEAKIKDFKESISDYQRALNLAKHHSNAEHYTHIQLHNHKLQDQVRELDKDNEALQSQLKALKSQLAGDERTLQYESYIYKSNTWNT
jgi:dynactin complex subunit